MMLSFRDARSAGPESSFLLQPGFQARDPWSRPGMTRAYNFSATITRPVAATAS